MGKIFSLREAINLIWETVEIEKELESGCPYLFIVGVGISAPEILTANGIIDQCKEKVEQLCRGDEEKLAKICDAAERLGENSAKYYSYWFEQAYKNKIHRQQYLKSIMNDSRISMSNLLLAQILKTKSPIVIGYSGWEDDVIMSKLRERLAYAALPYKLIWFCYSGNDYEKLPGWLKENEEVVFVLPETKKDMRSILKKMDYMFIPTDDLEHILSGVIMPMLPSQNRIEDMSDQLTFLDVVLDLLIAKKKEISEEELSKYLQKIIGAMAYPRKDMEKEKLIHIFDKMLEIVCLEEQRLLILGAKSECVNVEEQRALLSEIITLGSEKLDNEKIARLVLNVVYCQIRRQGTMTEVHKNLLHTIRAIYAENERILEYFYFVLIEIYKEKAESGFAIEDVISQIREKKLPSHLLISAYKILADEETDTNNKIKIASETVQEYDMEEIRNCRGCLDYANLVITVVCERLKLNERVERKYIEYSIKLCEKEGGCPLIAKNVVRMLQIYITHIENSYEKQEICKKAI